MDNHLRPYAQFLFCNFRIALRIGNILLGVMHPAGRIDVDQATNGPASIRADAACAYIRNRLLFVHVFTEVAPENWTGG